jgi:acyl phosphate:glycerol-3-phosphate acyltransferase
MKILFALASYLLGSIPTGYLLVRAADRRDIRDFGSGATGATNVLRVKGLKFAIPVVVVDVLKGFLPAFLGLRLFHDPTLAALAGFLAVVGHCFPFAIGFRGGKGMATSVGVFAALALPLALACLGVFVLTIVLTRTISLGSILGVLAFPLLTIITRGPSGIFPWGLALAALVVFKHAGNIQRLLNGTERKIGERKT